MNLKDMTIGAALTALLAISGCGVIYTVPSVYEGASYNDDYGTDYDLKVVPMTYETAAAANLEPYFPPRLPAAFQPEVALGAVASSTAEADLSSVLLGASPRGAGPERVVRGLPPQGAPEPYRIGVGDVLLLSISGGRELEQFPDLITARARRDGYTVQDDGTISIPDTGRAQVAGKTLQDAQYEISQMLLAANVEPTFSLEITEFNSQHVAVDGLVGTALVPITLQPLRLYQAIAQAGGLALTDPTLATIQILRGETAYQFGAERYISDPEARRIILRDGDSIYVGSAELIMDERIARADEETPEERFAAERALFEKRLSLGAVERYYVFLTGEIRNSGQAALPFEQPVHLAKVLLGEPGGGISPESGNFGAIYVIRAETDPRRAGGVTAYHLDAENIGNMAVATRFEMRPNDIIFVAEQPVTSWNRVLSQIFPLVSTPQRLATSVTGLQ